MRRIPGRIWGASRGGYMGRIPGRARERVPADMGSGALSGGAPKGSAGASRAGACAAPGALSGHEPFGPRPLRGARWVSGVH